MAMVAKANMLLANATPSSNCTSPRSVSGSSCDGKYTGCSCPSGVSSGSYGCEEYYPSPCSTVCKKAYADNCRNRTAVSTPYGCAEYWSDCSSKCKTAYNDNCRNRIAVSAPYGCQKYYADCQSKCEIAKTQIACNLGDVFYADYTCTNIENYNSNKIALGIVVYVTDGGIHGQIMSPWPVDANGNKMNNSSNINALLVWSTNLNDIDSLTNYSTKETAKKDYSSCQNTNIIISAGDANTYQAAWAAKRYAPTIETQGKWCLPAAGIMTNIYSNQTAIINNLEKISNVSYPSCCVWSSSERSNELAWNAYLESSYGLYEQTAKWNGNNVYPVLEF